MSPNGRAVWYTVGCFSFYACLEFHPSQPKSAKMNGTVPNFGLLTPFRVLSQAEIPLPRAGNLHRGSWKTMFLGWGSFRFHVWWSLKRAGLAEHQQPASPAWVPSGEAWSTEPPCLGTRVQFCQRCPLARLPWSNRKAPNRCP